MDNETMRYILSVLESAKQHLLQSEYADIFSSVLAIAKINHAIDVINEYQKENQE